ncbi:protein-glutamate O-methyltransferase CheR [Deinococcus sp. QL22]|uniref:CheR family methyltransferase n=1 Tax=Deinococcus sp. QL22 TaxID=2939437 RepID=UPI002017B2FA|nr:protein-glutamate O-methyltransferase CheR [Deinococcus sp. QL22]UQN09119.1 protein-glutamate O-methyltransferase CheR [Deinococcus sp. QL22]
MTAPTESLEDIEIALLLEGMYRYYGHDFRSYAPVTLRRRILHCLHAEGLPTVSALQHRVLHDQQALTRLLETITIRVTEMFRDPSFYWALRDEVLPLLRTYPFIRVWHAGCATGEEVYSLAILLAEAGLLHRTRLYATDISADALAVARSGIYSQQRLTVYADNYALAGGRGNFESYFTQRDDHGRIESSLRENIIWGQHNLATGGSFNEFHLILCRNVLIYFNSALQEHVQNLLVESLTSFGVLGLGRHESMEFSPYARRFATLNLSEKLYRRIA